MAEEVQLPISVLNLSQLNGLDFRVLILLRAAGGALPAATMAKRLQASERQIRTSRQKLTQLSLIPQEYSDRVQLQLQAHAATDGSEDPNFQRFWQIYPLRTARKKALQAWRHLQPAAPLAEAIIAHLKERVECDRLWLRGIGIPYPASFINGERWHDVYDRVKTTKKQIFESLPE